MTDWQNNYPPGTLPQDVSDRERREDDQWWAEYWLYAAEREREESQRGYEGEHYE